MGELINFLERKPEATKITTEIPQTLSATITNISTRIHKKTQSTSQPEPETENDSTPPILDIKMPPEYDRETLYYVTERVQNTLNLSSLTLITLELDSLIEAYELIRNFSYNECVDALDFATEKDILENPTYCYLLYMRIRVGYDFRVLEKLMNVPKTNLKTLSYACIKTGANYSKDFYYKALKDLKEYTLDDLIELLINAPASHFGSNISYSKAIMKRLINFLKNTDAWLETAK